MASISQRLGTFLSRLGLRKQPLAPRVFPKSGFEIIDESKCVEEECMSIYRPEAFYPVSLGDVFQDRYQVVSKLGFGSSSTIWLGHDLHDHKYVSLKIFTNISQTNHELVVYEHLKKHAPLLGPLHIRPLQGSFRIQGPHGSHDVLVQMPLAITMPDFQQKAPGKVFPSLIVREALKQVVPALDFLHSEAHTIHADFHPGNLLIALQDPDECFAQLEEEELSNPGPRKVMDDRTIYRSRVVFGNIGPLYLCDFGQARLESNASGNAMPISFRPPEVILGMQWSYPLDMWAVGLSAWDMLQAQTLFKIYDTANPKLNDACHLANMIALLGPPPLDYLKQSKASLEFWDEHGDWRGLAPIPRERTLESLEHSLAEDEREIFFGLYQVIALLGIRQAADCEAGFVTRVVGLILGLILFIHGDIITTLPRIFAGGSLDKTLLGTFTA